MNIQIYENGTFSLFGNGTERISHAPLGILVYDNIAYLPDSCQINGNNAILSYPHGTCSLLIEEKEQYLKLTLKKAPDGATGFLFGPYKTTATSFGEILGAGWYQDGSVVCIQSLMPKVEEGIIPSIKEDKTGLELARFKKAASCIEKTVFLHCSVKDRSKEEMIKPGFSVQAIEGKDALIADASVAFLFENSAEALLESIGAMEIAEGLPHPVYRGNYAKQDKRISSFYFVLDGPDMTAQERVDIACRTGVNCIYFSDLLEGWGHFSINKEKFPGGIKEVACCTADAEQKGVICGAHSLSNFIQLEDEYVTPIPHPDLLVQDCTELTCDIDSETSEINIKDTVGYKEKSTLNLFRIDDELITFAEFDSETKRLSGCIRGAFGTVKSVHLAKSKVFRLRDHGYKTVFPNLSLQDEVAQNLGYILKNCGIKKMSFDGLEGCYETGHGNYACARFVEKALSITGSELICDASIMTHYLWHAFSYCNWGEPHWDSARRGGTHVYRAKNQLFYQRNLIPSMLGWYTVFLASENGKWEATPPENMEYLLSRSAAFDAGAAFRIHSDTIKNHGLMEHYFDLIRRWNRFRLEADIPEFVRNRLKEEQSNWHLEETNDGWELTELILREYDLEYCDREVRTEAGSYGQSSSEEGELIHHTTLMNLDGSYPLVADGSYPEISSAEPETIRFRIRVGKPGCGYLKNLDLYGTLRFDFQAYGGDYLVYEGGTTLFHYDRNYRLLETIEGEGTPLAMPEGAPFLWGKFSYTTDKNQDATYLFTEFRRKEVYKIEPKR